MIYLKNIKFYAEFNLISDPGKCLIQMQIIRLIIINPVMNMVLYWNPPGQTKLSPFWMFVQHIFGKSFVVFLYWELYICQMGEGGGIILDYSVVVNAECTIMVTLKFRHRISLNKLYCNQQDFTYYYMYCFSQTKLIVCFRLIYNASVAQPDHSYWRPSLFCVAGHQIPYG